MAIQEHSQPRITPRRKLFMPVEASYLGRPLRMHLLDISKRGALAHCASHLAIGTIIRLTVGDYTSLARVQWRREDRLGLTLTKAIEDDAIDRIFAMPVREMEQTLARA